jgi:hypothetical protein
MAALSHSFARELADRLADILPDGLSVLADGSALVLHRAGDALGGSDAATIVDETDGRGTAERYEVAGRAVLDAIQDCVVMYLRDRWPRDASGSMAMPGAHARGGRVNLWYGPTLESAALALRPIHIGGLEEDLTAP